MSEELLSVMKEEIQKAVKETVNGKLDSIRAQIDAHNKKHEADMQEIKPFMQGAAGLQLLWKILIGIGSIAVGWLAIKNIFKP